MSTRFLKDALGWGFVLWLIGYALGIMLVGVRDTVLVRWLGRRDAYAQDG